MSWDLYLVPRERADQAGEWIEEVVLEEVADLEAAQEHARIVREKRPELEVSGSADSGSIRLCAPETSGLPVTVYLDGLHAELNVAYWDLGELASETANLVVDAVSALTEHTGWVVFDPQEDQLVSVADLRSTFLSGHGSGVALTQQMAEELGLERPRAQKRGFFQRFRR